MTSASRANNSTFSNQKIKSQLGNAKKTVSNHRIYPKLSKTNKEDPERNEFSREMQQVLERLRKQADLGDVDLESDSSDEEVKKPRRSQMEKDNLALHMMKVRMRLQEQDLEKVSKNAAKISQEKEKKSAEIEKLQKNVKNLQAFEVHQDLKIQSYVKQTNESRRSAENLVKEIDRLKRELGAKAKDFQENAEKSLPEINSVNRLTSLNDALKAESQQLKVDNRLLQESGHKLQQQLLDDKRRHQQEAKRFVNLIYKRNNYLDLLKKQRDHLATNQMFNFTEHEFVHYFQPQLPSKRRVVQFL